MKRALSFLLLLVLLCSAVACASPEVPPASGTGASEAPSSGSADPTDALSSDPETSGTDSGTDSAQSDPPLNLYDPNIDHKVILDDSSNKILVLDLDRMGEITNLNYLEEALIWEWDSRTAPGCVLGKGSSGVDQANFRYSAYWDRDVVIACGSGGWVGVIDYKTKEVLFEDRVDNCPHAVELLPNGDLVVAGSGGSDMTKGSLLYYPLSAGSTEYCFRIRMDFAHGVCWDPQKEVLWALGYTDLLAFEVLSPGTEKAKLVQNPDLGGSLESVKDSGGHNLSPAYGQPGKYWVTAGHLWLFDSETGKFSSAFPQRAKGDANGLKGVAGFADGTLVLSGYIGKGGSPEYMSTALKILYLAESTGKVKRSVVKELEIPYREKRQTYKVHPFCKDYQ